jgi:hypothetical protein
MKLLDWLKAKDQDPLVPRAKRYPCVLSACYWDGGMAVKGEVKDISETGAYVVTSERWFPGTILRLTLHFEPNGSDEKAPETITVPCKVVRHGGDGMGLSFVFAGAEDRKASQRFIARVPRRETVVRPAVELALMVPVVFLLFFKAVHFFNQ